MIAAVLWDLDGTLVDTRIDLAAAANAGRAAVGLTALAQEQVISFVGDGMIKLLERCCPNHSGTELEPVIAAFRSYYGQHCADHVQLYPGILDCLNWLADHQVPQAVVTNKPFDFSDTILKSLHLTHFFSSIQGGDGPRKPAPDQLVRALSEIKPGPGSRWMIGDHHTDILAGHAASCSTIFCQWGLGHIATSQPHYLMTAPADLTTFFISAHA